MRKLVLILVAMMGFSTIYAQDIAEPEFIGEAKVVTADGKEIALTVETAMTKTRAGATMYLVGMGSIKSVLSLEGAVSPSRVENGGDFYIILRSDSNMHSPSAYIKIFRFDIRSDRREAELSSAGTFSGVSSNNLTYVPFVAKKYGESSYLIKLTRPITGEYGIKLATENNTISTFGISGSSMPIEVCVQYMIENDIELRELGETSGKPLVYDVPSKSYIPERDMRAIYGSEYLNKLSSEYRNKKQGGQWDDEWSAHQEELAKKKQERAERKAKKRNKGN